MQYSNKLEYFNTFKNGQTPSSYLGLISELWERKEQVTFRIKAITSQGQKLVDRIKSAANYRWISLSYVIHDSVLKGKVNRKMIKLSFLLIVISITSHQWTYLLQIVMLITDFDLTQYSSFKSADRCNLIAMLYVHDDHYYFSFSRFARAFATLHVFMVMDIKLVVVVTSSFVQINSSWHKEAEISRDEVCYLKLISSLSKTCKNI